jgi:peptide/nickel transport system permease protein
MTKSFFKSKIAYHYAHDPSAIVGSFLLVFFILAALLAPWIAPQNPYDLEKVSLSDFLKPPAWMEGGDPKFLLGTDDQGRGILSTILYGCRTSLTVGFGVVLIAGSFGIAMGGTSRFGDDASGRLPFLLLHYPHRHSHARAL